MAASWSIHSPLPLHDSESSALLSRNSSSTALLPRASSSTTSTMMKGEGGGTSFLGDDFLVLEHTGEGQFFGSSFNLASAAIGLGILSLRMSILPPPCLPLTSPWFFFVYLFNHSLPSLYVTPVGTIQSRVKRQPRYLLLHYYCTPSPSLSPLLPLYLLYLFLILFTAYTIHNSGLVAGGFLFILMALVTVYSLNILIRSAEMCKKKSYQDTVKDVCPFISSSSFLFPNIYINILYILSLF